MPPSQNSEIQVGQFSRGYRTAAIIAAAAERIIDASDSGTPFAELTTLPAVSNGLPPPLWSFRSVCELPAEEEVFVVGAGEGVLEVSTAKLEWLTGVFAVVCFGLLEEGGLDELSVVGWGLCVVCGIMVWVIVLEVSTSKLLVSLGLRTVVVLGMIVGLWNVGCG